MTDYENGVPAWTEQLRCQRERQEATEGERRSTERRVLAALARCERFAKAVDRELPFGGEAHRTLALSRDRQLRVWDEGLVQVIRGVDGHLMAESHTLSDSSLPLTARAQSAETLACALDDLGFYEAETVHDP